MSLHPLRLYQHEYYRISANHLKIKQAGRFGFLGGLVRPVHADKTHP